MHISNLVGLASMALSFAIAVPVKERSDVEVALGIEWLGKEERSDVDVALGIEWLGKEERAEVDPTLGKW
jgi:hypothetical protein